MDLTGKQVLVAGLGKSGIAAGALLKKLGCSVFLFDENKKFDTAAWKKTYPVFSDCPLWVGELPDEAVDKMELAVVSPGIPLDSLAMQKIYNAGIPIWGESELAYRLAKGRVAAITGTNGKTTTTTLVGEILKKCYPEVFVVGNIGIPYTSIVEKTTEQTIAVAEISSFQLETMETFHPSVSAILNITPDHLDRHHTMEAYIRAKESITKCQTMDDVCILNYEDEMLRSFAETLKTKVLFFSSKRSLAEGIYLKNDAIWIAQKEKEPEKLIDIDKLKLLGTHNYENVMAASGAALCMGAPADVIQSVLKEFRSVKHRIELVRELHGVMYYNDSKATNPDAAIRGIRAMNRKTVLIGGGYDKELEFDEWIDSFEGKVKYLLLIGQTKEKIAECAQKHGFGNIVCCDTLKEAVDNCYRLAETGEAVLLSPACASWGDFKDYTQRGDLFRQYVMELPE
ncbi:UDP-N-acetylmuramoyl-L-alanine--D-glutamate ligase [Roseburia sp.]|uniref:UDP-N-acetylmuramoyl-L-alanine--D-glutamate ligase n=1 Tax=Roseburia sp. TaxID=2049040 RepID=UPI0035216937